MFVDRAKIWVKGGDGGNGCVAFRREKYVPRGGPSGGDGGRGGNVVLVVDGGLRTLMDFKHKVHLKAEKGRNGQGSNMTGADGADLVVRVPPGTVVKAEDGSILADLTDEGQSFIAARGGRGGRGNARFATPVRRAPRIAERGAPGEERWLTLELKLLADVGIVGFPNAGKSTLLSRVTSARPRIGDFPFTTLTPNLGVVEVEGDGSFVLADIPGLIEGAHEGKGLGHEFLRHIERTRVLIHVIDAAGVDGRDPCSDFGVVNAELGMHDPSLAGLPQVVALNKIDLPQASANLQRLLEVVGNEGYEAFPISAVTGEGVGRMIRRTYEVLRRQEEDARASRGSSGAPAGRGNG
ncbi:MAG: GTPase ObgE [Firmicutes bacterium]|jgi:GTP-binding protein|nr:GTPase ObgE [Bacillota bacterium]